MLQTMRNAKDRQGNLASVHQAGITPQQLVEHLNAELTAAFMKYGSCKCMGFAIRIAECLITLVLMLQCTFQYAVPHQTV